MTESAMAEKGIIFVSINYRVGVLGFLAHPELSKRIQSTYFRQLCLARYDCRN